MNFDESAEFRRELKVLKKKYKSLPRDLKQFRQVVSSIPLGNGKHFHILTESNCLRVIKARLFCRYLKGSSLRVVYVYCEEKQTVEFLEIYFKGEQQMEDGERIKKYLKKMRQFS